MNTGKYRLKGGNKMNLQQLNNNIAFKAYVLYAKRVVEMGNYKYVGSSVFDYGKNGRTVIFYYTKGHREITVRLFEGSEKIHVETFKGRDTVEQIFSSPQELKLHLQK